MQSTGTAAQNTEYRFYFEEVTGRDLLEVSQEVSGDDAELFWRPVNGDTNPENYIVVGTDSERCLCRRLDARNGFGLERRHPRVYC